MQSRGHKGKVVVGEDDEKRKWELKNEQKRNQKECQIVAAAALCCEMFLLRDNLLGSFGTNITS